MSLFVRPTLRFAPSLRRFRISYLSSRTFQHRITVDRPQVLPGQSEMESVKKNSWPRSLATLGASPQSDRKDVNRQL